MQGKIESEKDLERKLVQAINKLDGACIKLSAMHTSGIPDRLCLLPGGIIFFAEIKTTGQKLRRIQELMHTGLKKLGFRVVVIDSAHKIITTLEYYG